jgi:hypothetical protein
MRHGATKKTAGVTPAGSIESNRMDEKEDDLAVEYLHHALMNETREYLARGRSLAGSSNSEVEEVWVATFGRWFDERTAENVRNMG